MVVKVDVGSEVDIFVLFQVVDVLGQFVGFVNNVGVVDMLVWVDEMSWEWFNWMFQINVIGLFLCVCEVVKWMLIKYGGFGGFIVNFGLVVFKLGFLV